MITLLCRQDAFNALVRELVSSQPTPELRARLAAAFEALTSARSVRLAAGRANGAAFAHNLADFVVAVRGFVQIK